MKAVPKFTALQAKEAREATTMARRRKPTREETKPVLPEWVKWTLEGLAVIWMLGVLVWFFSDTKIRAWLSVMVADLLSRP